MLRLDYLEMSVKKYNREQQALRDKQQLQIDTLKPMSNPLAEKQVDLKQQTAICPFCLFTNDLSKFLYSCGSGFHKRLGVCPECKHKSELRTLVTIPTMTPQEYAQFVFDYRLSGFWEKCNFKVWRERLDSEPEQARKFWNRYYDLRGDYTEE